MEVGQRVSQQPQQEWRNPAEGRRKGWEIKGVLTMTEVGNQEVGIDEGIIRKYG